MEQQADENGRVPCPGCGLPVHIVSQGKQEGKIPYHRQRRVRRATSGGKVVPRIYVAERCEYSGEVWRPEG